MESRSAAAMMAAWTTALSLPPPATLGWLDWTVIAAYLVGAVALGMLGARRGGCSTLNFFLSGRSLPWWLVGTSLVSSGFASDTPLFVTSLTRDGGVAGNWRWWGYLVGTVLVVVLFARLWRRSGVFNDVEFMELRYSGTPAAGLRAFKAVYQVAGVHCIAMGWIFVGMQKLLGVVLGLGTAPVFTLAGLPVTPSWLALIGCVALMFLYCEVSGLWGVVFADLLQFPVAMAGAVTLALFVVAHFGGLVPLAQHGRGDRPRQALRPARRLRGPAALSVGVGRAGVGIRGDDRPVVVRQQERRRRRHRDPAHPRGEGRAALGARDAGLRGGALRAGGRGPGSSWRWRRSCCCRA